MTYKVLPTCVEQVDSFRLEGYEYTKLETRIPVAI